MRRKSYVYVLSALAVVVLFTPVVLGYFVCNRVNLLFLSGKVNDNQRAHRQALVWINNKNFPVRIRANSYAALARNLLALDEIEMVEELIDQSNFVPDSMLLWDLGRYYWSRGDDQKAYRYWSRVDDVSTIAFYNALGFWIYYF